MPNVNLKPRFWIMKPAISCLHPASACFHWGWDGKRGSKYPSFTPPITNRFQIDNILPFSCTKKISETVAEMSVSSGAAEKPCTTRINVNDRKLPAKNPHALVPNKNSVEIRNTGRFPHTAAAAAVKNVPEPVVICRRPTREKEIWSAVTEKVCAISSKPVVIIGPSLLSVSFLMVLERGMGLTRPSHQQSATG